MAKGIVDKKYMASEVVNERICETTCLLADPEYVNERKTAFINLVASKYKGEISSDEYEMTVEAPYATDGFLAADVDAASLDFVVTAETIDVFSEHGYFVMGDEALVIESVDVATNTVTVIARGHGGTTAAAHVAGAKMMTLVNVKATCEAVGDCRLPVFGSIIKNAPQRFDACGGEYCEEDLCRKLKDLCDNPNIGRNRVINDEVEKLESVSRVRMVEELDKLFLLGSYGKVVRADGTEAYTTRGLYSWIYGTDDANGVTHSGYVYDVMAEDACVGTAGDGTGYLTGTVLDTFFDAAGEKARPNWTHAILTYKTYIALKPLIELQNANCCGDNKNNVSFTQSDLFIDTPYGRVTILISDHAKEGKIAFFNESNIGWYSDCSMNGNVYEENIEDQDLQGRIKKVTMKGYLAFDAARNMCTDLALIENFTIAPKC